MKKHVVVLVLGDIGRSPRMQYHSRSLAMLDDVDHVSIVGYEGEKSIDSLTTNRKVSFHYIKPLNVALLNSISILRAIFKGIFLLLAIFQVLLSLPNYDLIIIQNPPGIPAVIIALLISKFNNSKVMIDWHNLGFSVYENTHGKKNFLVRLSYFMEKTFCSLAHYHLCVSKALKEWLQVNFNVKATVLYDRPGAVINQTNFSIEDKHNLLRKLHLTEMNFFASNSFLDGFQEESIQTLKSIDGKIIERPGNRIGLLISSTSWTADEDFSILLRTMEKVENSLKKLSLTSTSSLLYNKIICVITGKGELKSFYEKLIEEFNQRSSFVKFKTLWLEFSDYPKLLYCSNLGISLHTSTSGLDLPMKILDMFGSSLPVLAKDFPTIPELVQVKKNGFVFETEDDLQALIEQLLLVPNKGKSERAELEQMREFCGQLDNWDTNWNKVMKPLVESILNK